MRVLHRGRRTMLDAYAAAPTPVAVKSGVLLVTTGALIVIQSATLLLGLALQWPAVFVGVSSALLTLHAAVLWLLRRGRFRAAALLSMAVVYVTLSTAGATAAGSDPLRAAGTLTALLCGFVLYTSLVGRGLAEPLLATLLSAATVVGVHLARATTTGASPDPNASGAVIGHVGALGFVGVLSALSHVVYERSMRLLLEKAPERVGEVRRSPTSLALSGDEALSADEARRRGGKDTGGRVTGEERREVCIDEPGEGSAAELAQPDPWPLEGQERGADIEPSPSRTRERRSAPRGSASFTSGLAVTTAASAPEPRPPSRPQPDGAPLSVLVVDAVEPVRAFGAEMLARLGHSVAEANSGAEALRQIHAARFDVVILDVSLPDQGGREVFHALRAVRPELRVIVASGFSVEEDIDVILDAGARTFLPKPYTLMQLRDALELACAELDGHDPVLEARDPVVEAVAHGRRDV